MSSVDNRVVELKFDNRQFEAATAQSMATLDKLKKSLDFSTTGKSMEDLAATTKKFDMGHLGTVVEGVSGKFLALATIGVTALANITNKAIETGTQITKALTIDPISSGFQEYELKIGAIQTIMAGSGASLKTVNKYLKQLNDYSDKTIYSFSNMTQNIGKFTNAGVSLKDSVAAIQGIANVAAVSGANADEAARAMYNFAQALSKGSVALIDWKSIEMANMGTVEFKQQLIDAAVAQGTLTKVGKQYRTEKGTMLSATKGFNDALQDEWLTTKVLTKTLGDYANEQTKIGKKAFHAAQDVKTISQAYSTLKEAAGSGWAETFEILFGNLNEAKGRWTELTNTVGGWLQSNADARNEMLQSFKDMGGVEQAVLAIKAAFKALMSYLKPVGDAWREVFAGDTAASLLHIVTNIKLFFQAITLGPEAMENLKRTFAGLFSILHIGASILGGVLHFFKGLFDLFASAGGGAGSGLLGITAGIGDMIVNFDKMLKESGAINKFFDTILQKLKPVVEWLSKLGQVIGDAFSKAPDIFHNLSDGASGANEELTPLQKTIEGLKNVWEGFVQAVKDTWAFLGTVATAIGDAFSSAGEGAGGLFSNIGEALQNVDWPMIFKAALAGGFLAAIAGFVKAMFGIIELFINQPANVLKTFRLMWDDMRKVLGEFQDTLKTYQQQLKAKSLMFIAAAILLLAIALKILAGIPWPQLAIGTVAIGALFFMLTRTTKAIGDIADGEDFKKIPAVAFGMLLIGGALLVLATALKILAGIDTDQLIKGVITVGVVLIMLVDTMERLGKIQGKVLSVSFAILVLSFALLTLVAALWVYSKLPIEVIIRGGLAIAVVLAAIGLAMHAMPKEGKLVASAAAILILSFALKRIAEVMQMLAGLAPDKLLQAMYGLLGVMVIMVGALLLLSNPMVLVGAAAMIIAAQAINILARSLEILGNMSLAQLATSLIALVVALVTIAAVSILVAPAIPVMALLGGALLILGAAMALFGAGAFLFATAFQIAVGIMSLGMPVLADAIQNFIDLLPLFAEAFFAGIVEFSRAFMRAIPVMVAAVVLFIVTLLRALQRVIPEVLRTLGVFLDAFINFILDRIPVFVTAGVRMINGILRGIRENLPGIIENGTAVVIAWIEGIGDAALAIATAAGDTLIRFLEGLTAWIRDNSTRLNQAGIDLVDAIVDGITQGVGQLGGAAVDAIQGMAGNMIDGALGVFGIHSPSKVFKQIGKDVVAGLVVGIVGDAAHVSEALKSLREEVHKTQVDVYNDIKDHKQRIKDLEGRDDLSKKEEKELKTLKAELRVLESQKKKLDAAYKTLTKQHKKQRALLKTLGKDYEKTTEALDKATEALDEATQARDDYNKSITDQYGKLPDLAEDASLDSYFDGIRKATAANIKFKATLQALRDLGLDDASYKKFLEEGVESQPFLDALLAAGGGAIAELANIDKSLQESAEDLGKTASTALYQAGVDSAQGLVDGLTSHLAEITAQMKSIGKAIADEIKKELGIKSPSKVFQEIGKFTVQGLAKGMDDNANVIDISAKKMGTTAIDSLRESMADLSSVIGSEVNLEPVIAPVLDLDQFRKDAAAVNGILTPNGVVANASTAAATDISSKQQAQKLLAEQQAAAGGNVVEFNQYNTSPKALSTAEVYRQTKNQLSIVKEALGR